MTKRGVNFLAAGAVAALFAGMIFATVESRCQTEQDLYRAQVGKGGDRQQMTQFAFDRSWMPCIVERATTDPQASDSQQKEERDLVAQETSAGMAFWILVVAFLQMVATIIGLIYIRGTLRATLKAVEDTSEATKAMREANTIELEARRPWVAIDIEPISCRAKDGVLAIEAIAKFQNLGGSTATRVNAFVGEFYAGDGENYGTGMGAIFDQRREWRTAVMGSAILPGETITRRLNFMQHVAEMPFSAPDEDGEWLMFTILAAVHYQSGSGRPTGWLETSKGYLLQYRDDGKFIRSLIPKADMNIGAVDLLAEQLDQEVAT